MNTILSLKLIKVKIGYEKFPSKSLVIAANILKQSIERAASTKPALFLILLRYDLLQAKTVVRLTTYLASHKRPDFFI